MPPGKGSQTQAVTREKSPRRVAAGRRNRQLRGPLSAEGRRRLREAALESRPWRFSTGPLTPEGKAQVAENSRHLQKGSRSVRQWRAEFADVNALIRAMVAFRRALP